MEGSPPDLPTDGFSEAARDFVAGCLNKIPKLRPTYAMLLQHAWLAPLRKPSTIAEEDEDGEGDGASADGPTTSNNPAAAGGTSAASRVIDQEVADWVLQAVDRRRKSRAGGGAGAGGKAGGGGAADGSGGEKAAPALHAAPLDAVSPSQERKEAF